MSNETTLTLDFPVQLPDRVLSTLTVRRLSVGDTLDFPDAATNRQTMARLYARLCGLNVEDIRALDMSDYMKLDRLVATFLQPEDQPE